MKALHAPTLMWLKRVAKDTLPKMILESSKIELEMMGCRQLTLPPRAIESPLANLNIDTNESTLENYCHFDKENHSENTFP